MVADLVRPIAEKILDSQQSNNLQQYNDRYDTGKQSANRFEELQHRKDEDLVDIPDLNRGSPDSVINERVLSPWEVVYSDTVTILPEVIERRLEVSLDMLDGQIFDAGGAASDFMARVNKEIESQKNNPKKETIMILPVKQMNQWDSRTDEGDRMCASSVHAMVLHYLSPGLITQEMLKEAGYSQLDDYYLKELVEKQGGNTNDPLFHQKVLRQLGFNATLVQNADWDLIDRQLRDGIPVPMTFAHHGPATAPDWERWHWVLCRGIVDNPQSKAHIYNDPWGELDNVNGGYRAGVDGASMQYSDLNLGRRWKKEGPNSGWAMIIKRPFPARIKPPAPPSTPKPKRDKKQAASTAPTTTAAKPETLKDGNVKDSKLK